MTFEVRPGSKSIFGKIRAVMEAIDHIEKAGENKAQGYDYVRAEDVFDEVRQEFIKNGLVVLSACVGTRLIEGQTKSGTATYLTETDMEYTLCDVDTGDTITVPWKGQGQDSGDKGIYKAFTGAGKTFFKALAMIPAGDDPEKDDEPPPKPRAGQQPQRPSQPQQRPAPPVPKQQAPAQPAPEASQPEPTPTPVTEAEASALLDESRAHKDGPVTIKQTLNVRGMGKLGKDAAENRTVMLTHLQKFTRLEFDALSKKVKALPKEE